MDHSNPNRPDEYGIPPYRPERDNELAQQAIIDEMMQETAEPIQGNLEPETQQTRMTSWGFTTEELSNE